jgi:hypothetical protein
MADFNLIYNCTQVDTSLLELHDYSPSDCDDIIRSLRIKLHILLEQNSWFE